jgi:His-Xaa-Ser system radical SAM maturase HxsC
MIALNLAARFEDTTARPFVTRLTRDGADGACLAAEFGVSQTFQLPGQAFEIDVPEGDDLVGDVVFADPPNGRVSRWIRATSPHNTLLVTERCDQLCIMCSQPPKKSHTDQFVHFEAACRLAPRDMTIGISGGEPLLFKDQVFGLIESVRAVRSDISFHVLTNAQHFAETDLDRLRQPALQNVLWGVPLYAADASLHDEIVGKTGAQARLFDGLAVMARAGLAIELRTVLLNQNYSALPALAHLVSARLPFIHVWAIMQLERAGFARNRWLDQFVDHSADPGALIEAVSVASATGIDVSLYNVPYCTVPAGLRRFLRQSISDWKRTYAAECLECSVKTICSGFFEWHAELSDYATGAPV